MTGQQRTKRPPRKKRKYKKWKTAKKEKICKISDEVVGSKKWIKEVYDMKPKRKVSKAEKEKERTDFLNSLSKEEYENYKRTIPIKHKERKKCMDYQNIAERLGWIFSPETKTWKHPTYNKEFKSIVIGHGLEKRYIPHTSDEDTKGLAFEYKLMGCINKSQVYQNIWNLEDIHTRRGKRRRRFELKRTHFMKEKMNPNAWE